MPELPEVETVRRGLAPVMEGFVFDTVTLNRQDLRFPFAKDFRQRLEGRVLTTLDRRAKFLCARLDSGDRLYMHLGMSGRFTISGEVEGNFVHENGGSNRHDHVVFDMSSGARITYNDTRRFGFMELVGPGEPYRLDDLGPEPLGNHFNAEILKSAIRGKKTKIKTALLDQRIVAGLGNIYVCESLFRAGIAPRRAAGRVTRAECDSLTGHIKDVLTEAIQAGGSSLRDFANTDGDLGYFQYRFSVYGREAEPCVACSTPVKRITQSGRSSFYCPSCQK